MTFKKPEEVVGNHIAKYQALRLSKMLMAYDFERRLNPFAELGGFIFTFMGDGKPGTGKTTLIQMMAGLLNDYCKVAGYPFRYQNFSHRPDRQLSGQVGAERQGLHRQRCSTPSVIGFGTIDDIDQVAGKRGDRQSSRGAAGGDGGLHGGLRRGQYGGAGELHLRHVLELPRERGRRPAPAGRGAVSGGRAADDARITSTS